MDQEAQKMQNKQREMQLAQEELSEQQLNLTRSQSNKINALHQLQDKFEHERRQLVSQHERLIGNIEQNVRKSESLVKRRSDELRQAQRDYERAAQK